MGPIPQGTKDETVKEQCFLESAALDRLIHVLDVCQLLPRDPSPGASSSSSETALQDVLISLRQVQSLNAVWIREKDNLKHLLALEESIGTARHRKQACLTQIKRLLDAAQAESQAEPISFQHKDQEIHWESFLGTILTQAKVLLQQQLNYLQDIDNELDNIYHDSNSARSIGDPAVSRMDQIIALLHSSQGILLDHPMVQTARYLLFDLDASQLLDRNVDSSCRNRTEPTKVEPRVYAPPMLEVLDAACPLEALQRFCDHSSNNRTSFTIISISGDEGTGKSYCLDQMEAYQASCSPSTTIFRPSVPLGFLLPVVGDTENTIISMFEAAVDVKSCVIMLDNADELWRTNDNTTTIDCLWGSCLLSTMASLRQSLCQGSNIMVVVCSIRQASELGLQADKTFHLYLPDLDQRRMMIEASFYLRGCVTPDEKLQQLAFELSEMTTGRSYADLTQYIRQSFEKIALSVDRPCPEEVTTKAMIMLKDRLSKSTPPSLQIGRLDMSFEAVVLSGTDLTFGESEVSAFPFKGTSAIAAFETLNRAIVVPFCHYQKFQQLCGPGVAEGRSLLGGVLLCGLSGCGKSELAMYCSKLIALSVTTVTVLVISCTSLIHKEVGGSEQSVRRLFSAARKATPCIVILEGIENIGATRGNDYTTEGTMDRVLSTLLVELDGVGSDLGLHADGRLAIIATTIEEKWVDAALKRPGRLGNAILLSKDWM